MIHVMRRKKTSFLSVDDLTGNCILMGKYKDLGVSTKNLHESTTIGRGESPFPKTAESPSADMSRYCWRCKYMVKFGERLKAARAAKHMSQQALADVIGKSLNTVGLYERGLRQPSLETLCLLADTLEVSCDYLLARTDVKKTIKTLDDEESDLAKRVSRIEDHLGLN